MATIRLTPSAMAAGQAAGTAAALVLRRTKMLPTSILSNCKRRLLKRMQYSNIKVENWS
ncbi:hypothetical protein [Peribacillus saganii]|uniref:hypothetical protein n=1 Tax=Peribacillus saganii TaxID=2303992 RepID=UPI001F1D4074|nr:hypothetical protein [Peribacillus saganii]